MRLTTQARSRAALVRDTAAARWAGAALCGAALTLAQPPLGWWPLLAVWSLLALLLGVCRSPRAAAALGWWAGFGFFATGVSWIGEAFLVEAARVWWYAPLMPLAIGALAAVLAGFWAAAFGLVGWLMRRLPLPPGVARAAALAAAMLAAETARGVTLTGFPWALQAYALTGTPMAQASAWLGAQTLSALVVLLAAAPAGLAATASPRRRLAGPALALAVTAALWAAGAARLAAIPPTVAADAPMIRLVQPNIDQADKWAPENTRLIFDTLLALTAGDGAPGPTLVVWPEVAVTFLLDESPPAQAQARAALPPGATLAAGAVRRVDGRLRNSLLFYGAAPGPRSAVYDKRKLTPFGEYVPYAPILGAIGLGTLGEGLSGFQSGPAVAPFSVAGAPPVAPLVCYEIIFPRAVRRATQGAAWILQVTNDAWFGDSSGPWQHLAQARFRAIETGLPVARAANTGVSAMIDAQGRLRASLPLNTRGALDSPLPPPGPQPLWARTGDAPPMAAFLALVVAFLVWRVRTVGQTHR